MSLTPEEFFDIVKPGKNDLDFLKLGTIPATYTSGRPTVKFDGESVASTRTYPCLSSYVPAANDRVVLTLVSHVFTVIGKIDSGASPWIVPTLLNSWVNYGGIYETVGFMRDSLGFIHLKGLIKSGTLNTTIFTLPVGCRPLLLKHFMVLANDTVGVVQVKADGTVVMVLGSNVYLSLDSLTFLAEQ